MDKIAYNRLEHILKKTGYSNENCTFILAGAEQETNSIKFIERPASDTVRSYVEKEGYLIKALLQLSKTNVLPYYICICIAGCFTYLKKQDKEIEKVLAEKGIRWALEDVSGLVRQAPLRQRIVQIYNGCAILDEDKITALKDVYKAGYDYEKAYGGCAQCSFLSLSEHMGRLQSNRQALQCATALAGGGGSCGDGSCGAYNGSLMFISSLIGRDVDGVKYGTQSAQEEKAGQLANKVREYFLETYGTVICREIHDVIFGRRFDMLTERGGEEFLIWGGHEDKCTSVVGTVACWVLEVLMNEGLYERYCLN